MHDSIMTMADTYESCGAAYFLRRLSIASAAKPTNMPATIDSNGKPGVGGRVKGVETELDEVLSIVNVATGVLTVVVEVVATTVWAWKNCECMIVPGIRLTYFPFVM